MSASGPGVQGRCGARLFAVAAPGRRRRGARTWTGLPPVSSGRDSGRLPRQKGMVGLLSAGKAVARDQPSGAMAYGRGDFL